MFDAHAILYVVLPSNATTMLQPLDNGPMAILDRNYANALVAAQVQCISQCRTVTTDDRIQALKLALRQTQKHDKTHKHSWAAVG